MKHGVTQLGCLQVLQLISEPNPPLESLAAALAEAPAAKDTILMMLRQRLLSLHKGKQPSPDAHAFPLCFPWPCMVWTCSCPQWQSRRRQRHHRPSRIGKSSRKRRESMEECFMGMDSGPARANRGRRCVSPWHKYWTTWGSRENKMDRQLFTCIHPHDMHTTSTATTFLCSRRKTLSNVWHFLTLSIYMKCICMFSFFQATLCVCTLSAFYLHTHIHTHVCMLKCHRTPACRRRRHNIKRHANLRSLLKGLFPCLGKHFCVCVCMHTCTHTNPTGDPNMHRQAPTALCCDALFASDVNPLSMLYFLVFVCTSLMSCTPSANVRNPMAGYQNALTFHTRL